MSIRTQRIAEQIRAEISRVLRDESHDPRIGLLTITRVKLSPDLSSAVVFWSPLDVNGETDLEALAGTGAPVMIATALPSANSNPGASPAAIVPLTGMAPANACSVRA